MTTPKEGPCVVLLPEIKAFKDDDIAITKQANKPLILRSAKREEIIVLEGFEIGTDMGYQRTHTRAGVVLIRPSADRRKWILKFKA